ncbi:hypothetical protein KQI86_02485 [Clostridium sp. MSJ-11]|uniref:Tetratricopeptide repeat protein n=1 Tax=Clostridium mobile TaxID=2841512 RepID=A0ABS6EDF7_9CLOT|nr:hypothetical protein [Clostridium mobile]MBU5483177.1 hypothetical protein [Clostridium mobile]
MELTDITQYEFTLKTTINNINSIFANENYNFYIIEDSVLKKDLSHINDIFDNLINLLTNYKENLHTNFVDVAENIEGFLINVDYDMLDKKIILYDKIGDMFRARKDYYLAYTYYIKTFENYYNSFNEAGFLKILAKISYCCIMLNKYKESIHFGNILYSYINNGRISKKLCFNVLFNNALAYKKLNLFDQSLKEIEYIEKNLPPENLIDTADLIVLKSNCLKEKGNHNEAIKLNSYLLSILPNSEKEIKLTSIINLLELYSAIKDTENIEKCLDKYSYIIDNYKPLNTYEYIDKYSPEIYHGLGVAYICIGTYELAVKYFNNAIDRGMFYRNNIIINNSLDNLFDIYSNPDNNLDINILKYKLLELLSINTISIDTSILLRFINYYNEQKSISEVRNLLKLTLCR